MLLACEIPKAHYMSKVGGAVAFTGAGKFYVMFAGALLNTATGLIGTGFVAGSFSATGTAYV